MLVKLEQMRIKVYWFSEDSWLVLSCLIIWAVLRYNHDLCDTIINIRFIGSNN